MISTNEFVREQVGQKSKTVGVICFPLRSLGNPQLWYDVIVYIHEPASI